MAGKKSKRSTKIAKKSARSGGVAAKSAKPRKAVAKSSARKAAKGTRPVRRNGSTAAPTSAARTTNQRIREFRDSKSDSKIRFCATLLSPRRPTARAVSWSFLTLPKKASAKLPSRGQTTVQGTLNDFPFQATLEPDGQGGHWLKVDRKLREGAGAETGDVVNLQIVPVTGEPEPSVPADLRKALASAPPKVREAWSDITPAARRDFIHWITSPKRAETRVKRIETACDMLAKGKRRPCCFDRSGMYSKSLSCPVPDDGSRDTRR